MKATGIVRRIDDLGRIVIPKEIRKTLKVKEGMPLEIYTDQEGGIILKKYLPFSEFSSLAQEYAECILQQTGAWVLITDREKIIAAAGAGKGMKGQGISDRLEAILDDRNEQIPAVERTRFIPVADGMEAPSHVIRTVPSLNAQMTMMQAAFHRALADGKPLHGDEFYLGKGSFGFYQGMMRGLSNVTVFEWGKRA